jgi:hypothetical protein
MRKLATLLLALLVIGCFPGLSSARNRSSTYEGTYSAPAQGACVEGGGHYACGYVSGCDLTPGCAVIELRRAADTVSVEIEDSSGQQVLGRVYVPGRGFVGWVCGASENPLPVDGAAEIYVYIMAGTCSDSSPSTPTTGVVRVTTL